MPQPIVVERQETYGEFFDIPRPDELVFISSFSGGHETFRVDAEPAVLRVLANAVVWAHNPGSPGLALTDSLESPTGWFLGGQGGS